MKRQLEMLARSWIVGVAAWILFATPAFADYPIHLVSALCMNNDEFQYFSVHTEVSNEAAYFISMGRDGAPKDKTARIQALENFGLLVPDDAFMYSCDIGSDKISISGNRPPLKEKGECGGDPRIQLSLTRNDLPLVRDVYLEASCLAHDESGLKHPYVKSLVIEKGRNQSGYADLVLAAGNQERNLRISLADERVLDQKILNCLAEQGYFEPRGRRQALNACWDRKKD